MKVYLQYPWRFPDSPYYKYLIESPPEGVEYLNVSKQKGVITKKKFFWFSNFLKRTIRRLVNLFRIPILNAHHTPHKERYDLIHCAHCLSLNKTKWVADLESLWQLWVNGTEGKTKSGLRKARKILSRPNCKKIIAWTERTKREFVKYFPEIERKVEVVYPGIPIPKVKERKNNKEITLLFVGRYFYEKGGLDVLRTFDFLTKKYKNVECLVVSETPEKIKERYSQNPKIKFFGLMPQEELYEKIYSKTDIFVYPGYSDTFGFAMTEAMSFGIPVVSVEGKSRKEIVEEGKTGFVVERPSHYSVKEIEFREKEDIIKNLIEKTSLLIEDKTQRNKMSEECRKLIKEGKFSIKQRNMKLKKIYEEILNE